MTAHLLPVLFNRDYPVLFVVFSVNGMIIFPIPTPSRSSVFWFKSGQITPRIP